MTFAIPDSYYDQAGQIESSGKDLGYHYPGDPHHTAAGRYGIEDSTWSGLQRNYPQLGLTAANRLDPATNRVAMQALTQENAGALSAAGLPVTPGNLYQLHHDGATAGVAALKGGRGGLWQGGGGAASVPPMGVPDPQTLDAGAGPAWAPPPPPGGQTPTGGGASPALVAGSLLAGVKSTPVTYDPFANIAKVQSDAAPNLYRGESGLGTEGSFGTPVRTGYRPAAAPAAFAAAKPWSVAPVDHNPFG